MIAPSADRQSMGMQLRGRGEMCIPTVPNSRCVILTVIFLENISYRLVCGRRELGGIPRLDHASNLR